VGYTTEFTGSIRIEPPLNQHEVAYLRRFAEVRHMERERGPYYCGTGYAGQDIEPDVTDANRPCPGQPGTWCHWEPSEDGRELRWNGAEKFYYAPNWMAYLIDTFLAPEAGLAGELASPEPGRYYAEEFEHFTFDHVLNGTIDARGEEADDVWQLVVTDGTVTYRAGGRESRPIKDTSAPPKMDPKTILVKVRLIGGPNDGEVHRVPLTAVQLGGLRCESGALYRTNRPATVVDGCQIFEYADADAAS
jgi:hypothetical protein